MRVALFILLFLIPQAFAQEAPSSNPWNGLYAGMLFGFQFGDSSNKTGAFGYNADDKEWKYGQSGFTGGLQLGYNSTKKALVVGPEIEAGYVDMGGVGAQPDSPGLDTRGQSSSDFYTAIRFRAGVDVNQYLLFATVGAIGVDYKTQVVDDCNVAPCGGTTLTAQNKDFIWGYTVGAGVERLLGEHLSVKLEYLYYDLARVSFTGTTNLAIPYEWSGQTFGHMIRTGLNCRF